MSATSATVRTNTPNTTLAQPTTAGPAQSTSLANATISPTITDRTNNCGQMIIFVNGLPVPVSTANSFQGRSEIHIDTSGTAEGRGAAQTPQFKDWITPVGAVLAALVALNKLWSPGKQTVVDFFHIRKLMGFVEDCGIPRKEDSRCAGNNKVEQELISLLQRAQSLAPRRVENNGSKTSLKQAAHFPNVCFCSPSDDGHILQAKRVSSGLGWPLISVDCSQLALSGKIPPALVKSIEKRVEQARKRHNSSGAIVYLRHAACLDSVQQEPFINALAVQLANKDSPFVRSAVVIGSVESARLPGNANTPELKGVTPSFTGLVNNLGTRIEITPPQTQDEISSLITHQLTDRLREKYGPEATLPDQLDATIRHLAGAFPELSSSHLATQLAGKIVGPLQGGYAQALSPDYVIGATIELLAGQVVHRQSAPKVVNMDAAQVVCESLVAHVAGNKVLAMSVQSRSLSKNGALVIRERLCTDDASLSRSHLSKRDLLQEMIILAARIEGTKEEYSGCNTGTPIDINDINDQLLKLANRVSRTVVVEEGRYLNQAQTEARSSELARVIAHNARITAVKILKQLNSSSSEDARTINVLIDAMSPETSASENSTLSASHGIEKLGTQVDECLRVFDAKIASAKGVYEAYLNQSSKGEEISSSS